MKKLLALGSFFFLFGVAHAQNQDWISKSIDMQKLESPHKLKDKLDKINSDISAKEALKKKPARPIKRKNACSGKDLLKAGYIFTIQNPFNLVGKCFETVIPDGSIPDAKLIWIKPNALMIIGYLPYANIRPVVILGKTPLKTNERVKVIGIDPSKFNFQSSAGTPPNIVQVVEYE